MSTTTHNTQHTAAAAALTLVSNVLKLGAVVVLVQDEDVELTDADQRIGGLVSGRHRHRVLPLALAVEPTSRDNGSCTHSHTWVNDQTARLHRAAPRII